MVGCLPRNQSQFLEQNEEFYNQGKQRGIMPACFFVFSMQAHAALLYCRLSRVF